MVVLTIRTKEFRGIGPANGYPIKHMAYLFDDEDQALCFLRRADVLGNIAHARIIGGPGEETDIIDKRTLSTDQGL